MSRNRYIGDYHLADSLDERGRIHTDVEYTGALYSFADPEAAGRAKKKALGLCLAGWAAYVAAMVPRSAAMRTIYSAIPFALAAIPLALATGTVFEILPLKERFIHRPADRLENRYPAAAAFLVFLPALALAGEAVTLICGTEPAAGDWVFIPCAAAVAAAGLLLRKTRTALRCEKVS